jgi:aspartyl-tRNA(Asn)/glutamyl-tRNA(Gln) amidotransferase subunit C
MPITLHDVEHIANLARLELTDDEIFRFREQLSSILDYVTKLNTALVSPEFNESVYSAEKPLRADVPRPLASQRQQAILLDSAALIFKNQYRIPPVFEAVDDE